MIPTSRCHIALKKSRRVCNIKVNRDEDFYLTAIGVQGCFEKNKKMFSSTRDRENKENYCPKPKSTLSEISPCFRSGLIFVQAHPVYIVENLN